MSSFIYLILPEETCKQSEKKKTTWLLQIQTEMCVISLWQWYNTHFHSQVFKISHQEGWRGHTEELFRVLSSSVCSDAFFCPRFPSPSYSFGVRFEIWGLKCCYFHLAPSKMNIWLKDKTQGVRNQSVNYTISSQPALSSSHQVSWLVGFIEKKSQGKKEAGPVHHRME